jgi:hypothetical protein
MTETPKQAASRLAAPWIAKGYKPAALHTYTDAAGKTLFHRFRLKHLKTGEKIIRPFHLNGSGYELGEPEFANGKKPLYALNRIAANADAIVWVVEGEQKADALNRLGLVATTSGSATSAAAADWEPLRDRTVIIWPDNDEAGKAYAAEVATTLIGMGCSVSCVEVDKLAVGPGDDVMQWLAAHPEAARSDLAGLPRVQAQPTTPARPEAEQWSEPLAPEAFHGIAGEIVRFLEPDTESDPGALLMQILAEFGSFVGRNPYYEVEGAKHHANINEVLIGETSKSRKGTSANRVRSIFSLVSGWKGPATGLSTGEGLKYHVRDARQERKKDKSGEYEVVTVDEGVADKRLLVIEPEFSKVLKVCGREHSTLSATIRELFDTGNVSTLTKRDPVTATGAHVSIIGHITLAELRVELTTTDAANGFANRFLFVATRRSKLLPFGGANADPAALHAFADRLGDLAALARSRGRVTMSPDAAHMWIKVYPELSAGSEGLHGAITARAEALTVRLALIYALLDGATQIDAPHLLAALAVWQYSYDTAKLIFGDSLGHRIGDEILRHLRQAGEGGLTRTEISNVFKRNVSADRTDAALELLKRRGRVICEIGSSTDSGRPPEIWKATKRYAPLRKKRI